jgi:hypothetical protein
LAILQKTVYIANAMDESGTMENVHHLSRDLRVFIAKVSAAALNRTDSWALCQSESTSSSLANAIRNKYPI